jgi:O-antigen ligase
VLGAAIYCAQILTTFEVGAGGRLGNLFYYDSNDLAMLVVCTLPFVVFSLRPSATSKLRIAALGIAALFVLTIVKAGSRGGFLGLIAVSLYLLLGFRAVAARIRFGAVALCAILLFSIAGPQFWNMMGTMLHPKDDYNFNGDQAGRQAVWERGIGYMKGNPVFGVGANAFPAAEGMISELVEQQKMGRGIKWSAAHNAFVQIGAELGVPGLIALIAQIVTIVATCIAIASKRSRASPDERALAQAMIGTVVGYVVCGFFLSQAYSAFLYAACALTVGLASIVGQTPATVTGRGGRARAAVRRPPRWSRETVAVPNAALIPATARRLPRSRSRWQQ